MARRPTDYTTQMQAAEERRRLQEEKQREERQREEQLRERQASSYGQVVLEIMGTRLTIDELAGLLLENLERAQANPALHKEWAARGIAYFRPNTSHTKRQPAGNGATGKKQSGNTPPPAAEPGSPQPGRAASPRGPDLLGGLAPDQPGQGAPKEGNGHG